MVFSMTYVELAAVTTRPTFKRWSLLVIYFAIFLTSKLP